MKAAIKTTIIAASVSAIVAVLSSGATIYVANQRIESEEDDWKRETYKEKELLRYEARLEEYPAIL